VRALSESVRYSLVRVRVKPSKDGRGCRTSRHGSRKPRRAPVHADELTFEACRVTRRSSAFVRVRAAR
jgi:hypothetical protein